MTACIYDNGVMGCEVGEGKRGKKGSRNESYILAYSGSCD